MNRDMFVRRLARACDIKSGDMERIYNLLEKLLDAGKTGIQSAEPLSDVLEQIESDYSEVIIVPSDILFTMNTDGEALAVRVSPSGARLIAFCDTSCDVHKRSQEHDAEFLRQESEQGNNDAREALYALRNAMETHIRPLRSRDTWMDRLNLEKGITINDRLTHTNI